MTECKRRRGRMVIAGEIETFPDDPDPWKATKELRQRHTALVDLMKRTYNALHRGHWEDGETENELCTAIHAELCNQLGSDWLKVESDND